MKSLIPYLAVSLLATVALAACSPGQAKNSTDGEPTQKTAKVTTTANESEAGMPAPIKFLKQQGLTIEGTFKAPDGMTGYAASFKGKPVAIYVTPDSKYAIVGSLLDGEGNNLTAGPLKRIVSSPKLKKAWAHLEEATWIKDGQDSAPQKIYMFTDPNCPYCHMFWENARPWVKAGQVQIRHVMIGLLKPSSLSKSATILAASDPVKALTRSEQNYKEGGIKPMDNPPAELASQVKANTDYMKSLGFFATPTIIYRDPSGSLSVIQGVPRTDEAMEEVMGSPKPAATSK
jgi:thiol:disulfide interchange protein DsbG